MGSGQFWAFLVVVDPVTANRPESIDGVETRMETPEYPHVVVLEFGVNGDGELVVGDEFSPDSCRMVDAATGGSMDKNVFRLAIGDLRTTYQSVLDRIGDA